MGSEQKKGPLTEEELTLRLSYFSRQCWHQRHLYSHQNAALRQRIADQDAQLKDAHDRLRDAHSRLQEVTAYLGQTFQQLQDVMAARIAAELKLAGYGLLESSSSLDLDFKDQGKSSSLQEGVHGSPAPPGFHPAWMDPSSGDHANSSSSETA